MACGENPKRNYKNTRMGLVWLLRKHLAAAKELQERQSAWCRTAANIDKTGFSQSRRISQFLKDEGRRPESFELETSLALLRGELNVNVHCYEPEDLERMLSVLHEFGIHPSAFHHALEAWEVPELLKSLEEYVPFFLLVSFTDWPQKHHYCHFCRECALQSRGIWGQFTGA
jgi:hypothetical protein